MKDFFELNDVKPCPFCGSEHIFAEKYQHDAGERWRIVCGGCCAGIERGYDQTPWTAREAWNKRTEK